jgi:simple sugar transport system permease protein
MTRRRSLLKVVLALAPVLLTLALSSLMLLLAGANPVLALADILSGAFGSLRKLADVAMGMVPLLLCSAGMLVTFAAGLWNIGVEGQMVAGALMATWVAMGLHAPAYVLLPLTVLAGMAGGALWGLLIGLLRTAGRVNEIFAGLGLNFVAVALTNYLIYGPWRPPDGATASGTDPFPQAAWMPVVPNGRACPTAFVLAVLGIVVIYILLRDSQWGLRLKAVGLNERAAYRLGIKTSREIVLAFVVCGVLAGLAGSLQATAVHRRLVSQISGGYGYLAQLVVLLSGLRAQWVPIVVFFFSAIQVGSLRLEMPVYLDVSLDSSMGGVLQASVVLFFLLVRGLRERILKE